VAAEGGCRARTSRENAEPQVVLDLASLLSGLRRGERIEEIGHGRDELFAING